MPSGPHPDPLADMSEEDCAHDSAMDQLYHAVIAQEYRDEEEDRAWFAAHLEAEAANATQEDLDRFLGEGWVFTVGGDSFVGRTPTPDSATDLHPPVEPSATLAVGGPLHTALHSICSLSASTNAPHRFVPSG